MRQSLMALFMALTMGLSFATFADDAGAKGEEVKGMLTKIDGAIYVITDTQGVEQRINVNDTTQITGEIAEGQNVEIYVENGIATTIKLDGE